MAKRGLKIEDVEWSRKPLADDEMYLIETSAAVATGQVKV